MSLEIYLLLILIDKNVEWVTEIYLGTKIANPLMRRCRYKRYGNEKQKKKGKKKVKNKQTKNKTENKTKQKNQKKDKKQRKKAKKKK